MESLIITEHILIPLIPGAQNYKLHSILTDFIHDRIYQIKSLLICQSGNNTKHKLILILRQSQLLLKCQFVVYLVLFQGFRIIILSEMFISFRIVNLVIDSVHNSYQRLVSSL